MKKKSNTQNEQKLNKKEIAMVTRIIIISCIITSVLIGCYCLVKQLDSSHQNINNSIININENEFTFAVEELSKYAENNVNRIAKKIESSIKEEYAGSMDDLKNELESDNYYMLSEIISYYIQDEYFNNVATDGNRIFVANYYGIICDYSHSTSSARCINSNNKYRHWEDIVNSAYNKESCSIAIDKIVHREHNPHNDIIIWQYNKPDMELDIPDGEITVDTLKDIYIKKGVKGLKSFELLIPSYITEDGDIFGQKDISLGIAKKNYKLIAVQRINLYDQFMELYPTIDNHNFGILDMVNEEYESILFYIYLLGFCITVGFVLIIIHFCTVFNRYLELSKDNNCTKDSN